VVFQFYQKSMTLNDLERQFTALSSVLCVVTIRLRLESCGFHYILAIGVLSLTTKLKKNPFEFQTLFLICLRQKLN